ncbi:Ribosomal RNA-processing protein 14/surfeit locus protein 6, C-terminal domain [Dillenia turbinata]|uniref:Ribosomal RNA-processing protein 14/surfeit locus protein 6, C-terminal domain n=1 Tax=Dillenia turbinata TaxID=194707 RepID=A0AAN8UC71_9MAGN
MKKKKQKTVSSDTDQTLDLKSVIHENSSFFDKLIELIPARFYLPTDDANENKPWFHGLSKTAKASVKKQSRENLKKARRDRLDPEKATATTLDLLNQSLENQKAVNKENLDNEENEGIKFDEENKSATYEELQIRLRRRIEELRSSRGGSSEKSRMKNENKKREPDQKKRKRDNEQEEEKKNKNKSNESVEKDVEEAAKGLAFSHVKLGDKEELGKKKKRKVSKLKELERAKRLEEAKKDPEKGENIARKYSWKAATSRAAGVKVHDDPKLLKQSIQKEKRRHDKNVEKWKGRVENTLKMKAERQQVRSEHIKERIHQKKMRRIAKREKKLMRPGFEGRKEGFINEDQA